MREGVIKFHDEWEQAPPPDDPRLQELCRWRNVLFRLGLIGATPEGIGYGNVSIRSGAGARFYITGTGTGALPELTPQQCTEVLAVDIPRNTLRCRGPVRASSESLSHAALYLCSPAIGGVVHVHHRKLWNRLFGSAPTTAPSVPYGTPEMATELMRIYTMLGQPSVGLIVMGGHEDGLLAFGESLRQACDYLLRTLQQHTTGLPIPPEC